MRYAVVPTVLVFTALLGLASCSASRNEEHSDPRIRVDPAVGLDVESVSARRNRSDTLDVEVQGSNPTGHEVKAQYKLEWVDDDNRYVPTIMSRWEVLMVPRGEQFHIDATAPATRASSFRLQIRKNLAEGFEK